jgi:hypothetical protein
VACGVTQAGRHTHGWSCRYHGFTRLSHHEQDDPPEDREHQHPEGKHQDITPSSTHFDAIGGLARFTVNFIRTHLFEGAAHKTNSLIGSMPSISLFVYLEPARA